MEAFCCYNPDVIISSSNSGIWFEEEYIRRYPNNTLACDVIGFTGTDNNGQFGLEEYYNDVLNGAEMQKFLQSSLSVL